MKSLLIVAALSVFSMVPSMAQAACSNPAGVGGDQIYNADYKVMQFCDGTYWNAMGAMTAGGGASRAEVTVWGTTTCPSGYSSSYTGTAVALFVKSTNYPAAASTICSATALSLDDNTVVSHTGWVNGSESGGGGNTLDGDKTISCAQCYKSDHFVWGTTSCPSGYSAAYTGTAVAPFANSTNSPAAGSMVCSATALSLDNNTVVSHTGWINGSESGGGGNTLDGDKTISCAFCVAN
jgi:hypothetical protein